jgi:chromosome segregation ATPase
MFEAMKQHGFGGRGAGQLGKLLAAILAAGWITGGCATTARQDQAVAGPSAAELATTEATLEEARQKERGQDRAIDQHLAQAERTLAEAKDRVARGERHQAGLLLARAQADIELGQAMGRRERALAEAEVMEKQLLETRAMPPAPNPATTTTTTTTTPEVTP